MKNFIKNRKGFTLVELVVVIAILGILAGLAIPRFMDATATARGARIVADLRTIDSAIMMYNAKTGTLPTGIADLTADGGAAGKLLVVEPTPVTGDAIFPSQANTNKTNVTATEYDYDAADGRATIDLDGDEYTAEQLSAGGSYGKTTPTPPTP